MHLRFWTTIVACGLLAATLSAAETTLIGGPTRVIDADTLEVKGETVRLEGIDAPEKTQRCKNAAGALYRCGQAATRALRNQIGNGNVTCRIDAQRDRYGRALGVCYLNSKNLNAWLVSQGHALAYRRYSTEYVEQEQTAQAGRQGMWAGEFIAPWRWRNGERLQVKRTAVPAEPAAELDPLEQYDDNRNGRITCKEARRHGIAPVPRGHPAYPYMRDADNDGVVCE